MKQLRARFLVAIAMSIMTVSAGWASVPSLLHYQGVLTDTGGTAITVATSVTFTLYDAPAAGNDKWSETRTITPDDAGRFAILLGQANPLHDSVFKHPALYMGITVESDPELMPRFLVASAAYSFRISTIDGATGGTIDGDVVILSSGAGMGVRDPGGDVGSMTSTAAAFVTSAGDTTSKVGTDGLFVFDQVTGDTVIAISSLDTSLSFGPNNTASGQNSFALGSNNDATGQNAVAFGNFCTASGNYSSVSGGSSNSALSQFATVGGGTLNSAIGTSATVGGGWQNGTGNSYATVGGGNVNQATGSYSAICGGQSNQALNTYTTVCGGSQNSAQGGYSFIGGGGDNQTNGAYATVPGGRINSAFGELSMTCGYRAKTTSPHYGAFVWADSSNFDFVATAANEFSARATGGVRFVSAIDGSGVPTAGVTLASGGGSWASISDRNAKENIAAVDGDELLKQLSAIPVATWNYKSQDASIRHIGPMAQDFYSAFGVGEDDKHITTIDADGVALAAIQELHRRNLDLEAQIAELRKMIRGLSEGGE